MESCIWRKSTIRGRQLRNHVPLIMQKILDTNFSLIKTYALDILRGDFLRGIQYKTFAFFSYTSLEISKSIFWPGRYIQSSLMCITYTRNKACHQYPFPAMHNQGGHRVASSQRGRATPDNGKPQRHTCHALELRRDNPTVGKQSC